jgi:hypothetical protein
MEPEAVAQLRYNACMVCTKCGLQRYQVIDIIDRSNLIDAGEISSSVLMISGFQPDEAQIMFEPEYQMEKVSCPQARSGVADI